MLSKRFKGRDLSGFYNQLNTRGKELGLVIGNCTLLSNSRLALQASEYARDLGKYASFHENIFHAYFTRCLDIGNPDVIATIAGESGLDAQELFKTFADGRYLPRLAEARKEGEMIYLTGVPTFIIEDKYKIVGAQPLEVFYDLFRKIGAAKK